MSKKTKSLDSDPIVDVNPKSILQFKPSDGPNGIQSIVDLNLKNNTGNYVLFKIKTTAPKRYCVRPNSGQINPNDALDIQVMLQPPYPPKLDVGEKPSKFLVQVTSLDTPLASDAKVPDEWKKLEKSSANILEQRLKCEWLWDEPAAAKTTQAKDKAVAPTTESQGAELRRRLPDPNAASAIFESSVSTVASSAVKAAEPAAQKSKPVVASTRRGQLSNDSSLPGATATVAAKGSKSTDMMMIFLAFLLGIIFAKFVL